MHRCRSGLGPPKNIRNIRFGSLPQLSPGLAPHGELAPAIGVENPTGKVARAFGSNRLVTVLGAFRFALRRFGAPGLSDAVTVPAGKNSLFYKGSKQNGGEGRNRTNRPGEPGPTVLKTATVTRQASLSLGGAGRMSLPVNLANDAICAGIAKRGMLHLSVQGRTRTRHRTSATTWPATVGAVRISSTGPLSSSSVPRGNGLKPLS